MELANLRNAFEAEKKNSILQEYPTGVAELAATIRYGNNSDAQSIGKAVDFGVGLWVGKVPYSNVPVAGQMLKYIGNTNDVLESSESIKESGKKIIEQFPE